MKLKGIATAALLALAGIATAGAPAPVTAEERGVTADSITIGAWLPLSGPYAEYGVNIRAGTNAYFDMINAKGGVNGRKINWIVEDNAYSPQQTVSIARKLVTRDNVLALVNVHGTGPTSATFPFVRDQMKVPFTPVYGGAKEWYDPPKTDLLGMIMLYINQMKPVGRWAASDGHKNIVFMQHIGNIYDEEGDGSEIGVKSVNPDAKFTRIALKFGTADYASVAKQIKDMGADAIISVQVPQELAALRRELKRIGVDLPMYTFPANVLQSLIELDKEGMEGLRGISLINSPTGDSPELQEYRDAMKTYQPDAKPDSISLLAFSMAKVFVEALKNAKEPLNRESLMNGYFSLTDYDTGILPPVTFTPERTLGATKARRVEVVNGEWKVVGPWEESD